MTPTPLYNFRDYLRQLISENRLAQQHHFHFTTCSGIASLEGLLQDLRTQQNMICFSDITEDSTFHNSGAWFKRRVFTIFIVLRFQYGNQTDYDNKINTARELFRQLHSRFLHDEQELNNRSAYLDCATIRSRELGGHFLDSATGLYFLLTLDEPTSLAYDNTEWT